MTKKVSSDQKVQNYKHIPPEKIFLIIWSFQIKNKLQKFLLRFPYSYGQNSDILKNFIPRKSLPAYNCETSNDSYTMRLGF